MNEYIRRQDVLNEIWRVSDCFDKDMLISLYIGVKMLPSAQPEILACGEGELIAQPELRSFSCGQENDLISRQAAIDAFDAQCWERINIPICKEIRNAAKDTINALPSAKTKPLKYSGTSICCYCKTTDCGGCLYEPMAERREE